MNAFVDVTGVRLQTERLLLRPFEYTDLDDLYAYASVPGVGEAAGWEHHASPEVTKIVLRSFIENKKTFAITDISSGRVIGSLGIEEITKDLQLPREYDKKYGRELGFVLAKDFWGMGLMPEAVRRVIDWCFSELSYDFLICGFHEGNERSRRVQEKCGFVHKYSCSCKTISGEVRRGIYGVIDNTDK